MIIMILMKKMNQQLRKKEKIFHQKIKNIIQKKFQKKQKNIFVMIKKMQKKLKMEIQKYIIRMMILI